MSNGKSRIEMKSDLNTNVTILTAIISAVCLIITTTNSCTINNLDQRKASAKLVGDLTGHLSEGKAQRDISLLALEHTLNPEPNKDHYNKDKLLLARITSYIIAEPKTFNTNDSETSATNILPNQDIVNKSLGDIKVATRILRDMIYKSEQSVCKDEYEKFTKVNPDALNLGDLSKACGSEAYDIAAQSLIKNELLNKDSSNQTPSISTLALDERASKQGAAPGPTNTEPANPNQVLPSIAKATVLDVVRQEKANDSKANVIIHAVDPPSDVDFDGARIQLADKHWYIAPGTKIVKPTDRSCVEYSSVRFFHADDKLLANDLRKDTINVLNGSNIRLTSPQSSDKKIIGLIDLSDWSYAKSVPKKTLELWFTTEGTNCIKEQRDGERKNLTDN